MTSKATRKRFKEFRHVVERGRVASRLAWQVIAGEAEAAAVAESESADRRGQPTVVSASLSSNRLFVTCVPAQTVTSSPLLTTDGTTALNCRWVRAKAPPLVLGDMEPMEGAPFDWRGSDAFLHCVKQAPQSCSEFRFAQRVGSGVPGATEKSDFSFKSAIPGMFLEKWKLWLYLYLCLYLYLSPSPMPDCRPITVSLRGSCEVEPPNLGSVRSAIDASLHESGRARCIADLLDGALGRVMEMVQRKKAPGNIEGESLLDGRAPVYERVNEKRGLKWAPGLFAALNEIVEAAWESLGTEPFQRLWDYPIVAVGALVMKLTDFAKKRELLAQLNAAVWARWSESIRLDLSCGLAWGRVTGLVGELQPAFEARAAEPGRTWLIPKIPTQAELEASAEPRAAPAHAAREIAEASVAAEVHGQGQGKGGQRVGDAEDD